MTFYFTFTHFTNRQIMTSKTCIVDALSLSTSGRALHRRVRPGQHLPLHQPQLRPRRRDAKVDRRRRAQSRILRQAEDRARRGDHLRLQI